MFINKMPQPKEERYWAFATLDKEISLFKVKILKRWYDRNSKSTVVTTEVLDIIYSVVAHPLSSYKIGQRIEMDFVWQLQETLEDAKKLLIMGAFFENAFYYSKPVWER